MAAAKAVHATIVMVGLDSSVEAEGLDRVDLLLPEGRLPLTWYEAGYVKMLPMKSMPLRPIDTLGYPGRAYKLLNGSTPPDGIVGTHAKQVIGFERVFAKAGQRMEVNG
ncbi:hypothetical protein EV1_036098 [Malus domestica]